MSRIKGQSITLDLGGVEYESDTTNVVLDNEEASGDVVTYGDHKNGGSRQWFFTATAAQNTATSSFWSFLWSNTGSTVPFRFAPHGNAVATADEPHVTGMLKIGAKPALGGGVNATATFDVRFDVVGEPQLDRGASAKPAITSITPAGAEVGDTVMLSGSRFIDATDVKFGTTSATSFVIVADTVIVATVPAGTGAKAVTVTNVAGASDAVNYTVA